MALEKERKVRRDKGQILATPRDLYCIAWIAEQQAARVDQIRQLLSRFPDRDKPFKGKFMAETTLKDMLNRWRRAGWIESRRVLVNEPAYAWPTRRGLQLVGLDGIYRAHEPSFVNLHHLYAINQVRLWMDLKFDWMSERRYRSQLMARLKKGDKLGPLPDGLVKLDNGIAAVEVEISPKKPAEMVAKLKRLVGKHELQGVEYKPTFAMVWFYVPDEVMEDLIEKAADELTDKEYERLEVHIVKNLLALPSQ